MSDYTMGATSPPTDRGRPWVAGLLGLGLGPFGVGVALDTRLDPLLASAVYFGMSWKWGGWGMTFGLLLCAGYNVARVLGRNAAADAAARAAVRAEARRAAEAMAIPYWVPNAPKVIEAVALPPVVLSAEPKLEPAPAPMAAELPLVPVTLAEPAAPEALPEPPTPAPAEPPAAALEPAAEVEPPSPPVPPAPRKRGRPKGSRKLAA